MPTGRSIRPPSLPSYVARRVRGRYESARRLRSTIGSAFRYAIATARAEADPTICLRGRAHQSDSCAACRGYRSEDVGRLAEGDRI
ncbi:phage integrase central domain-containing protein [Mesorhizobium australafricanum]|uniref:phage integrase central domain-containing protein n=1 Tax=Mesorhizobium australafricanum TaxID=3072311 RepID=UPI003D314B4C